MFFIFNKPLDRKGERVWPPKSVELMTFNRSMTNQYLASVGGIGNSNILSFMGFSEGTLGLIQEEDTDKGYHQTRYS